MTKNPKFRVAFMLWCAFLAWLDSTQGHPYLAILMALCTLWWAFLISDGIRAAQEESE